MIRVTQCGYGLRGVSIMGVVLCMGLVLLTVFSVDAGVTNRVNVNSAGNQANGRSFELAFSADGRFVAFDSDATNLVSDDTNGVRDIFVHDRQTGQTTRVSVDGAGTQANGAQHPTLQKSAETVAYVAFQSQMPLTSWPGTRPTTFSDIFLHDRQTGADDPRQRQ